MLKRSILTPVLSGVLAVAVVGSGVLYYFDRTSDKEAADDTTVEGGGIAKVSASVGETVQLASKALKGELDFAYNAEAELRLGDVFTQQLGYEFKPIGVSASTKQKGKKTAADMSFKYDSQDLISLNTVVDNEAQVMYISCPQLSDAYLSASADEFAALMEESGIPMDEALDVVTESMDGMSTGAGVASPDQLLDAMAEFDYDALAADIEEYWSIIVENCPDGVDNGNISGDINGNSYDYSVKTYEVTAQVVYDIADAVVEKAQNDEFLKDMFLSMGMTEADYDEAISSMTPNADGADLSQVVLELDVYYDGDEAVGFETAVDGEMHVKMISISTDEVNAIDMSLSDGYGAGVFVVGAVNEQDGKVNGSYEVSISGEDVAGLTVTMTDLQAQGNLFSGSMDFDVYFEDGSTTISPAVSLTSNSTADKLDLTLSVSESGTEYGSMTLTGEKTDASDITIPSGNIYTLDDAGIESYMATCNPDELLTNLETALGTELYNEMFGASDSVYDDGYDYDYDLGLDDYDSDDYSDDDATSLYSEYDVDLSDYEITLAGEEFSLPATYSDTQSLGMTADDDTIEAFGSYSVYADDYSAVAYLYNSSDEAIDIIDAPIASFSDYDGSWLSVNGVTTGSDVSELERVFTQIDVENTDYTNVMVGSDEIYLIFCIEDGVVSYISYYDDTVYDF